MDTFRRLGAPTPISPNAGLSSNNNRNNDETLSQEISKLWSVIFVPSKWAEQGTGIKGKEMALVRCFADQYSKLTHSLLVQTHNMTTVKEIVEQCRQL